LDELLGLLDSNHFVSVHYSTIHRELECVGVSLKKLKQIVKERNEQRKMAFTVRMSQYSPEEIGFLDERMNVPQGICMVVHPKDSMPLAVTGRSLSMDSVSLHWGS
jgi:hypothetical protein